MKSEIVYERENLKHYSACFRQRLDLEMLSPDYEQVPKGLMSHLDDCK